MVTGAVAAAPHGGAVVAGTVEEQQAAGVGILLQISMLVLSFVLGHLLRRRKFYYLPEASASLLIGEQQSCVDWFILYDMWGSKMNDVPFDVLSYHWMIVGGLANISNTQKSTSLAPKPFFSNFGAIITFAILGTFIASIVTGLLVYLGGLIYIVYRLPLVECMMFGALVSATDPVTVLSIFQELGTDTNLYALVFGESVLNDAVAISLYRTMVSMRTSSSGQNFFLVILRFLENFVGSMSSGIRHWCCTDFCSHILILSMKKSDYSLKENKPANSSLTKLLLFVNVVHAKLANANGLEDKTFPVCKPPNLQFEVHLGNYTSYHFSLHNLESCLFVLFPYFSYMLAEGLGLSGIVSILFTGIVMKRYTFCNLSEDSQRFTARFFHLLSSLAEAFVFIYMGFDIAMERQSWSHIGFIFFSIIFILLARAANVFSCAYILNLSRPPRCQIPRQYQLALWYSGLRGAMAFALALQSVHDLPDGHGETIVTATTSIVVLTVSCWMYSFTIIYQCEPRISSQGIFGIREIFSVPTGIELILVVFCKIPVEPMFETILNFLMVMFKVLFIGGSTGTMLEALQVVGDSNRYHHLYEENSDGNSTDFMGQDYDEGASTSSKFKLKLRELRRSTSSFALLDKNYLTPIFTSQNVDDNDEDDENPNEALTISTGPRDLAGHD
ncbi:hypothetical protein EJB05_43499 [Eragrostis curvula]|uniref:Cation/H+ exchanger transmembrane domain-containing protein n=1 Tax=Eragrostis curvula TaxID=38414 RepID=A0A5J9TFL9_9POAL|nr:hypothetical protein EJB05_43499 [Eragrostis curvula]